LLKEHFQQKDQNDITRGQLIMKQIEDFLTNTSYPKTKIDFRIPREDIEFIISSLRITTNVPKLAMIDKYWVYLSKSEFILDARVLRVQQSDEFILRDQMYVDTSRYHVEEPPRQSSPNFRRKSEV
jgi:hypothetical protein